LQLHREPPLLQQGIGLGTEETKKEEDDEDGDCSQS